MSVIDPKTIELEFEFVNENNKSCFLNNLGGLLVKKLEVKVGGTSVYTNNGESVFSIYHDKWKSDKQRAKMARYGLAKEEARKLWSGFEPKPTDDDAVLLTSDRNRLCVKLDRVFAGAGALYPMGISQNIIFKITIPEASEIMDATTGSKPEGFTLKDAQIRFESITFNSFDPGAYNEDNKGNNLAEHVNYEYSEGKEIFYDQPKLVVSKVFKKDSTVEVVSINEPIRMLDSVVILFTESGSKDSEKYVNPKIERIDVTVEGKSNLVYERGILGMDLFREASRLFGGVMELDNVNEVKFLKDTFAAVIDFRTVAEWNVAASGLRLKGSQSGIVLRIQMKVTSTDLDAHIFVVSNSILTIQDNKMVGYVD